MFFFIKFLIINYIMLLNFNTLYLNQEYDKPIHIIGDDSKIYVTSDYDWKKDVGILDEETQEILFEKLPRCILKTDGVDFGSYKWELDSRKNLLFIGANDMDELHHSWCQYYNLYNRGLFIEAIPEVYQRLQINLDKFSQKYHTNYKGINNLVTSNNEEYTFNVFSNQGASSSIYEPSNLALKEWKVKVVEKIKLQSVTIEQILARESWNDLKYDVVLDVQGSELEVMKGFGKDNIKNINKIEVEASKKCYYQGGVLFEELNNFFLKNNFKLVSNKIKDHGDILYIKNNNIN